MSEVLVNGCEQPDEKREDAVSGEDVKSSEEPQPHATEEEVQSHPSPQEQQVAPPPAPTIKHDWYQTQADVYVNVMVKRLKRDDVSVEFGERSLDVSITLGDGGHYSLTFTLAHNIVPQKSSFKVLSTKVEVKMRKCEGVQWVALEGSGKPQKLPQMAGVEEKTTPHKYPSSSHYTRDWDKLVAEMKKEEKDEKLEGDAALNQLFQQIYKDGNEETRKAMNKSFVESGGTVLSTNWNEVGQNEVERKPPDGMEWKSYEK